MRGVGVIEFGGPEALQVVDLPETHAGAGEVRLRVHAATVNPTDTFIRGGARAEALRESGPPPYIPGMDAAGVVDEIGPDTETDLQVGDAVMGDGHPARQPRRLPRKHRAQGRRRLPRSGRRHPRRSVDPAHERAHRRGSRSTR